MEPLVINRGVGGWTRARGTGLTRRDLKRALARVDASPGLIDTRPLIITSFPVSRVAAAAAGRARTNARGRDKLVVERAREKEREEESERERDEWRGEKDQRERGSGCMKKRWSKRKGEL